MFTSYTPSHTSVDRSRVTYTVMVVCRKCCCDHKSLFCCGIPRELYDVEFPWYRQMFLLFGAALYLGDTGLDIFVAYEHHKHYLEGDDKSKWYFILTLVFVILPSVVMNFVSWGLYSWCYIVNNWPQCRIFLRKRSLKLKRKFDSALMYINYSGSAYSPAEVERRQRQQLTQRITPRNEFRPLDSLDDDLQRIAMQNGDMQHLSSSDDRSIFGDDEMDANIEFKAIDDTDLSTLLIITILHVFQLGLLVRVLRVIYLSTKNKYSYYRYYDVTFLRLIESFMESAPQLILQLYIYIVSPDDDPVYRIVTPISMLFSLVSLALAITDYHSAGKDTYHYMFKTSSRLSWTAYFVVIFWQLCLIISRTLAFTFFATEFGLYLFAFLLGHFLLMVVWIYSVSYKMCKWEPISNDQTDSRKSTTYNYACLLHPFVFLARNCCLEFVIAAFNSFFFFNFTIKTSKLTFIIYYTIQGIENFTLICLFLAITDSPFKWNNITGSISTFVSFALGMGFMLLYYYYYHPAGQSTDQPDGGATEQNLANEFYGRIHLTFTLHWLISND